MLFGMLVATDCRVRGLTILERDLLRTIAERARRITAGESSVDERSQGRLFQDVLHMLHIIGGEFAEGQER